MIAQGEARQGRETIWTFSATHVNRKWTFHNMGQWSFPNFLENRLYKSKDRYSPRYCINFKIWYSRFYWSRSTKDPAEPHWFVAFSRTSGENGTVSLPVNVRCWKLSSLKLSNCAFGPRISRGSRLFTDLYFSVRSSRSSALRYGLPSCMSVKTT